jgi:hypothetical protein
MKDDVDNINRIADVLCTAVLIAAAGYFGGSVIAAWLRGAFQAVTR